MPRELPPILALRAFDAAAYHLSFTKAAEELHVTHGAISRQVRGLEKHLGVQLFRRANRAVVLTDAGQVYYATVRDVFDRLTEATRRLHARERSGVLTVSTLDSFAVKWLVPRLARFREYHPHIDVRLSTGDALVDFVRDGIDIAIRHGQGNYPGLRAERLMTEELFLVCSPKLLEGDHPLISPQDLRHHALLHDGMRDDWRLWLNAAGVRGVDCARGPAYPYSNMTIQAALQGDGVALARSALVEDDLKAQRLVRPFELSLPVEFAYYVVYPEEHLHRPKVKALRDWLFAEVLRDEADAEQGDPLKA